MGAKQQQQQQHIQRIQRIPSATMLDRWHLSEI